MLISQCANIAHSLQKSHIVPNNMPYSLFFTPTVINPTFLFLLYFIKGEVFVTGTLLHIYAIRR